MALDRVKMSQIHEVAAAELVGGTASRGSGNQWTAPADGRASRVKNEYGWGVECKATCGQGIEVTRKILDKLAEQAEGERPLLMLRWYDDETFERASYDLAAMNWADFSEIMSENATLRQDLATVREELAHVIAAGEAISEGKSLSPGSAADMVRRAQAEAAALRRERDQLAGLVSMLGLLTPEQRELAEVGMPPRELWPFFVIDVRDGVDAVGATRLKRAWHVDENGAVKKYERVGEIRVDRGIGRTDRLFVDGQIVRRGELRVDGALKCRVTEGTGPTPPEPQPFTGTTETSS